MRLGGSASIVTVFTALYPLPVVLLAPLVLHEHITSLQSVGVACGIIAIVLLSLPPTATEARRAKAEGREAILS
jgi:drug/metabolite transporter (DMT)-like permease